MAGSHLRAGIGLETVFGNGFPRVAGTAGPEVIATLLSDGAFKLDGCWSFASRIRHCGWLLANAVVVKEDGSRPGPGGTAAADRIGRAVVTAGRGQLGDVIGLEGTGGCYYQAHDVIVQPEFITLFGGIHADRGGPWFRT